MDTEEPSDFKSLLERFQSAGPPNLLPAHANAREEKPIPPPKISNIRFNPVLQGVISSLENQVPVAAPPIATKPELPPKPNGLSKDTFLVNSHDMRLSKVFRKTLPIMDSTRTSGVGMCTNSPQVYRQSLPTFEDPLPEANQPQTQEIYDDVISARGPPAPINDLKISGSKPLLATEGPNQVKMTRTPVPDDNSAAKDERKKQVPKDPPLKILPSIASLGPPPSKPSRPLNVDLSAFFIGSPQQSGVSNEPEDSSEVEYEWPAPSPASNHLQDKAFSPEDSTESDPNVYEVDAIDCDNQEAVSPEPDASSLKESDESLCYEDVLKLRESSSNEDVCDTNPVSSPETAYEVPVNNIEVSTKSSVSEGYYSADMDTTNEVKIRKNEQMFRKKFKISGLERILYTAVITEDFKPEKHLLPVMKGHMVEVIRIADCPAGKCLARDAQGNHGFVPVGSLQVFSEIQTFSTQHPVLPPADREVYTDIEVRPKDRGVWTDSLKGPDSYSAQSDDQYDDISTTSQTSNSSGGKGKVFGQLFRKEKNKKQDVGSAPVIPNMNRMSSQEGEDYPTYVISDQHERGKEEKTSGWKALFHTNKDQKGSEKQSTSASSGLKKIAKEEKIFREKFKYTGEINIINIATINDLAPLSPKKKLQLAVKPGETVEVIDITSENQIICRNFAGKYGYIPIEYLNFNSENCT